jgi:iron(III) transport system substrate-binding protein
VKVIVPQEGAPYAQMDLAFLKNAPHANAARVFMQHFLNVESSRFYANAWMLPVVKGAAERADPDAQPLCQRQADGHGEIVRTAGHDVAGQETLSPEALANGSYRPTTA